MLETTPLHPRYGLQVHGLQLADVTAGRGVRWNYQQARSLANIGVSVSARDGLEEMGYRAAG